ncbi:MAG: tetratricopeptide repeat protein [Planctomycetes bacterium]|nr:tetratricopeptide repeat protein [Planctomycetota bacterium]
MRRAQSPLVLVLPFTRPTPEVAEFDFWLGSSLARALGKRLETTGRRVVGADQAARLCRTLGFEPPSGPLPPSELEGLVAQTGADFVVHGSYARGRALSLDLHVSGAAGAHEAVAAAGPEATFQDVLDEAARRVLLVVPGGPVDDGARRAMRAARGTGSLDAFLALARARAAWAAGQEDAFEAELGAATRLDPSYAEPYELQASVARAQGDGERVIAALGEVAALHARAGRRHEQAEALLALGHAHVKQGDWSEGVAAYEEAAALFDALGLVRGHVQARTNAANVLLRRGDHRRAIEEYTVGLEKFADYPEDRAKHVFNLGLALKETGDLEGAVARLEEARELGVKLRDDALIASAYNALGTCYDDMGDSDRALQHFRRAEEYLDALSDPVLLAGVKDNIGIILKKRGQLRAALEYSEQACQLFETRGDPLHLAMAYVNRAGLLLELEREDEATPFVVAAHREFVRLGSPSTETTERMLRDLGLDEATIASIPDSEDDDLPGREDLLELEDDGDEELEEEDDDDDDDNDDEHDDEGSGDEVEELEEDDEVDDDEDVDLDDDDDDGLLASDSGEDEEDEDDGPGF